MQLSVSTTPTSPTDANLAAIFLAPSVPGANDAARATTGFAEMLSDVAAPVGAPVTPVDAIAGGPLTGSAASALLANFPNWLVAAPPGNDPRPVAIPAVMVADGPPIVSAGVSAIPIPADASAAAELAGAIAPAAEKLLAGNRGDVVLINSATVPAGKNVRAIRPTTARATVTPKRDLHSENSSADVIALATPMVAPAAVATVADSEPPVTANAAEVVSNQAERGERAIPSQSGAGATVASVPKGTDEGSLAGSPSPASQSMSGKLVAAHRAMAPADAGEVSPTPRIAEVSSHVEPVVAGPQEWLPQNFTTEQASPLPVLSPRRIASVPVSSPLETEAGPVAVNFGGPPMVWPGHTPTGAPTSAPKDIVPAAEVVGASTAEVPTVLAPELAKLVEPPAANAREFSAPVAAPTIQFDDAIPTRAEIFAAIDGSISPEKKSAAGTPDKTFLSAAAKRVAAHDAGLGIGVAKSETVMPTATLSNRPLAVAPLERAPDAPVATAVDASAGPPTVVPAVVAHRAVDAVLTAVERFSAGDRHAVQLQFSVGGADLSVRVELRGEEVRTTFRTDSPELRNALAHEWQAASAPSADRSVRLAPPVFASHPPAGFGAFSGDTSSHQREARARRSEAEDIFSAVATRARPAPAFAANVGDSLAATVRSVSGTALHLSTLA